MATITTTTTTSSVIQRNIQDPAQLDLAKRQSLIEIFDRCNNNTLRLKIGNRTLPCPDLLKRLIVVLKSNAAFDKNNTLSEKVDCELTPEFISQCHWQILWEINNSGGERLAGTRSLQEILGPLEEDNPVEDDNLVKCWGPIREQVQFYSEFSCRLESIVTIPSFDASADTIRTWMNTNQDDLKKIKFLNLGQRNLTCLPKELGLFINLETLFLHSNQLQELSSNVISRLTQLGNLSLNDNALEELPFNLFHGLTRLQEINLSRMGLKKVPNNLLQGLTHLIRVNLSSNKIKEIPSTLFEGLNQLEIVYLFKNKINELHCDLFKGLTNLRSINLMNNKLKTLPANLFNGRTNLEHLTLNNNQIKELSPELFNGLRRLECINLRSNQLEKLPSNLFNGLVHLYDLNLSDNHLTELSPNLFKGLLGLQDLYLYQNQLEKLPSNVFDGLPELQEVSAFCNPFCFAFCDRIGEDKDFINRTKHLEGFYNYHCKSQFSHFYQYVVLSNGQYDEGIKKFFAELDTDTKNTLFGLIYAEAGSPPTADCQWGEHHAFDDMEIFCKALQRSVRESFQRLTELERNEVYGHLYQLAQEELAKGRGFPYQDFNNMQWGALHAKDNTLRLIDAMGRLENK